MYNCIAYYNYRLILIAEKETVYEKFPTPLINRLEKHFVLTKTILLDWQNEVLKILETWVNDFCDVSYSSTRYVCICIHVNSVTPCDNMIIIMWRQDSMPHFCTFNYWINCL